MGAIVAERVDRPLSLFDELEALAPATLPERERPLPDEELEAAALAFAADEAADGSAAQVRGGVGGEPTLDEMVVGAWEGLTAQAVATCPVCDAGTLRPIYADAGGASPPVAGRCTDCGTTLS